jgi:hypothetical protein
MVCGVRAARNHGCWCSITIGVSTLPCAHHAKHGRRLDRRRSYTEYRRHEPVHSKDSSTNSHENSSPKGLFDGFHQKALLQPQPPPLPAARAPVGLFGPAPPAPPPPPGGLFGQPPVGATRNGFGAFGQQQPLFGVPQQQQQQQQQQPLFGQANSAFGQSAPAASFGLVSGLPRLGSRNSRTSR